MKLEPVILIMILVLTSLFFCIFGQKNHQYDLVNPVPIGSRDFPVSKGIRKNHNFSGSKLYFQYLNTDDNENGVCKSLGYEKALLKSSKRSFFPNCYVAKVNTDGEAVSAKNHGWMVRKITCINYLRAPNHSVFLFWRPHYPDLPDSRYVCLSDNSREDLKYGNMACQKLGYKKAFYVERDSNFYNSTCMSLDLNGNYLAKAIKPYISRVGCAR